MQLQDLSRNDSSVLAALFDPESSLSSTVQIDDQIVTFPTSAESKSHEQERLALQPINRERLSQDDIDRSISLLTNIIKSDAHYASAWSNRAQARRLLFQDDELSKNPTLVAEIFQDLAQAILLSTPDKASTGITRQQARVLASAHTHRGYLLLVATKSEDDRKMMANVPGFQDSTAEALEEAASRELALGGRYGNEIARQLAVKTNPYAKLCGSIVREALTKEISNFYQPQLHLVG